MRFLRPAVVACVALLAAAAACSTFDGEPDPNPEAGAPTEGGADASSATDAGTDGGGDGAIQRIPLDCSGAFLCEDFDQRADLSGIGEQNVSSNVSLTLAGALKQPERRLVMTVGPKGGSNTSGQIKHTYPPRDQFEASMRVELSLITGVELMALN